MKKDYSKESVRSAASKFLSMPEETENKSLFAEVRAEAKADQEAQAPEAAAEDKPKKSARKPAGEKKRTTTKKSTPKTEKPVEATEAPQEGKAKRSGKPFSIYVSDDVKQKITAYTAITGMKTSQLITEAVLSYITEHKITEEQKTAYQNRHKMITDIMNELS